jgi:hypothetical protein
MFLAESGPPLFRRLLTQKTCANGSYRFSDLRRVDLKVSSPL